MTRVMWLVECNQWKDTEISMLRKVGFDEIYLPKNVTEKSNLKNVSLNQSQDELLTIPENDLQILNNTNWFQANSTQWNVANKYFEILFFDSLNDIFIKNLTRNFIGAITLRSYNNDYLINAYKKNLELFTRLNKLDKRFFLTTSVNLSDSDLEYLKQDHIIYLPLGEESPNVDISYKQNDIKNAWQNGINRIINGLKLSRSQGRTHIKKMKKRIAILVPLDYRGMLFTTSVLFANALWSASYKNKGNIELIFAYDDRYDCKINELQSTLSEEISIRPFKWKQINSYSAKYAMGYKDYKKFESWTDTYIIPDDGIQQFIDCDLWIITGNCFEQALLPIRPYILMVQDYIQRYLSYLTPITNEINISAARNATCVLANSNFVLRDILQYAGVDEKKTYKIPMFLPEKKSITKANVDTQYFTWSPYSQITSKFLDEINIKIINAFKIYYAELEGKLKCQIINLDQKHLLLQAGEESPVFKIITNDIYLRDRIDIHDNLSNYLFMQKLSAAQYHLYANPLENEINVINAANMDVPTLALDHPVLQEINTEFNLNIFWLNSNNPQQIASQIKSMEDKSIQFKNTNTISNNLKKILDGQLANQYWEIIAECL